MAKIEHPLQKQPQDDAERVERWLYLAFEEWQELPEVEANIDSWDLLEQLDFIEEWPLAEMRLERLERYAEEGKMSAEQRERYQELLALVEQYAPIIERLRGSRISAAESRRGQGLEPV